MLKKMMESKTDLEKSLPSNSDGGLFRAIEVAR